jgi:predicted nucleotide-binding protein
MNKLSELKYNIEALHTVVNYHAKFFIPISSFVKKLKTITIDNPESATKEEILFLSKKIEDFFDSYRPTGSGLYLPPTEASNNDDTVKEIFKIANELSQLSDEEFQELLPINTKKPLIETKKEFDKTKVFIVHGHDDLAKNEMARLISDIGYEPIILHEQASSGKTIIEKIESYSDVGFAVVLYTPCDKGGKDTDPIDLKSRARQNVVFEHGYLIGKLGRDKVCALVRGSIEIPNDISGVVYLPIDSHGAWKYAIADEMSNAGYDVDKNRIKT